MNTTIEVMSPAQALGRYVEHVCAIRDVLGVQVRLAVTANPGTNGWVIQARVKPPIRITATEAEDGSWQVTAIRYRRCRAVASVGGSPAALVSAIKAATEQLAAQILK